MRPGEPLLCVVALCLAGGAAPAAEQAVVVSVRGEALASDARVSVGDVAAVEGGPAALRERITRLDLVEIAEGRTAATVSREQIAYRIRLAGIDPAQFRVQGAMQSRVTLQRHAVSAEEIEAAARRAVLRRLPWSPEDVTFRLVKPVQGPVLVSGTAADVRVEAEPRAGTLALGVVHLDVAVSVRGERRQTVPVCLEVKAYQKAAVCTRRVERGETLGETNVHFDRRPVQGLHSYVPPGEGLLGKRAKHTLQPGHVVSLQDLEAAGPEGPVLVKQREQVKLIARLGALQVTAVGEALQDGRDGQWVRVRNVDSKKVVLGRVVGRSMVEVDF